jgi:hypothetical protein
MTGRLIRILAFVTLMFGSSQTLAQDQVLGADYRWLTLWNSDYELVLSSNREKNPSSTSIMSVLSRAFVSPDTQAVPGASAPDSNYYRLLDSLLDSELALPQAFRRPRQMRLGFSIRF